jgi:hypothetical protein
MSSSSGACQEVLRALDVAQRAAASKTLEDLTRLSKLSTAAMSDCWSRITANALARPLLSEFIVLAEIYIVLPVGSVADECMFSALTFVKSDYRCSLAGNHLSACVRLFTQPFYTVHGFPYQKAFKHWKATSSRGRYGLGPMA